MTTLFFDIINQFSILKPAKKLCILRIRLASYLGLEWQLELLISSDIIEKMPELDWVSVFSKIVSCKMIKFIPMFADSKRALEVDPDYLGIVFEQAVNTKDKKIADLLMNSKIYARIPYTYRISAFIEFAKDLLGYQ